MPVALENPLFIVLAFCGPLTLQTAMLLIEKCDSLSFLGDLDIWSGISGDDQKSLFDCVKTNDLALTVRLR
jgi:hypothetical protein